MTNQYEMAVRDADMVKRKMLMLASLFDVYEEAIGVCRVPYETEQFIERCARNGIHVRFSTVIGPYEQTLNDDDGTKDHS